MTEILYTGSITVDELPSLAAACRFSVNALLLTEDIPDHTISSRQERQDLLQVMYFSTDILAKYARYMSGRIFQEDAELRWEKQANKMRVVYLGPQEYSSILRDYRLQERQMLATWEPQTTLYYLFGKRLKPEDVKKFDPRTRVGTEDFAQIRIPRFLHYPVKPDDKPYVCLRVCEYIEKETGQVALFRFQGLETADEPE